MFNRYLILWLIEVRCIFKNWLINKIIQNLNISYNSNKMQVTTSSNVDRYQKMDQLGEGTYGVVYKAKDKVSGDVNIIA